MLDKVKIDFITSEVEEFQALLVAFREIFEEEEKAYPERDYLAKLLEDDHLLVITATLEGEVIGGLTAYRLPSYEERASTIYIYDLGVKEAFRMKGIGKKLVSFLLDYAQNHHVKAVFVDTEEVDNEEAIAFYNTVGFDTRMKVLQYTFNCQSKVGESVEIKCR